jgi:hypothetical protein
MRYFLDTEFIEDGRERPIQLISIGIAAEDGREFYGQCVSVDWASAGDFVARNVYPNLEDFDMGLRAPNPPREKQYDRPVYRPPWYHWYDLRDAVKAFISGAHDEKPEFWGYYADYDWVVFCQLFGTMSELPKGWPMYCRDLKQWCDDLGNPRLPEQGKGEHHALADAQWNKRAWEYLQAYMHGETAD